GSNSSLYNFYFTKLVLTLSISKEINALDSFVLGTCCTYLSIFSMNSPLSFQAGCKDNYFFFPAKLFAYFF
ncbi:MAG: hypothetical protein IJM00_04845, partial [Bacteroidales bacterium]|nr:hypothetical protein [Bacteroidales bacterium]